MEVGCKDGGAGAGKRRRNVLKKAERKELKTGQGLALAKA